jgi:micrococcal nuclease
VTWARGARVAPRRSRVVRATILMAATILALFMPRPDAVAADSTAAEVCALEPTSERVVSRVERADALVLDDGSEALLAGIVPPIAGLAIDPAATPWPPAVRSKQALDALVGGQTVALAWSGRRVDRYGRALVQAFVGQGPTRIWVQGHLVDQGYARAFALQGSLACFDALLAREQAARSARRGHWATGVFHDRDVSDPGALFAYRDSFQTLEGRVARVRKIRGQVVIAFTPGGPTSFEAVVMPGSTKRAGSMRALEDLVGKHVRVRGWVELRRHPMVQLVDPGMIELLAAPLAQQPIDGDDPPGPPGPIPASQNR